MFTRFSTMGIGLGAEIELPTQYLPASSLAV